jgi:hypothetical protein
VVLLEFLKAGFKKNKIMAEQMQDNPIYKFMKANDLTKLDEKSFLDKYSAPDKAKEIHSFMVSNKLTDLDDAKFYDKYLKKKVGGEESSLTKSPSISQEYLKEGQELADKGFIKTEKLDPSQLVSQYKSPDISLTPKPKKNYYNDKLEKGLIFDKEGKLYEPSSEALTKAIAPAEEIDLKKPTQKDLVEKSREAAVVEEPEAPIEKQGWLLNMVSALDKGFAKNFISSPIKGLGTVLQGATKKVMGGTGEGFISNKLIQYGDYLNKAIDELTPQDEEFKNTLWDQAAQALGQVGSLVFTGGLTGAAGKGAALVSQAPKGAAITAAKTLGSQLSSPTAVSAGLSMGQAEFDRAKEAGATDDQAFEAFYKNALTGSVLETIPVMQFFKRFNNSTGGSVANYIKTKGVAGITGGIEEMTTEVLQQIYSNKTAKDIYNINQDILDGVGSSGGIGFGVGFVLNAMGANAKILRKQGREQEATVLENQVKQYEDNLENPKVTSGNKVSAKDIVTQGVEVGTQKAVKNLDRDLANNVITPEQYQEGMAFAEKAAQVANKIPETVTGESRVKSIELLVERNDINQANQNLLQQKQTTDVAYHAGIDEEIKANEERIKKIDSEVYNIAKKPSKEFGGKKYIVDGEEVSQAEFEALQGKPLGTKEIIKAPEVKPTEVTLEEEYNSKNVDELIALKKKLYPSPDIESPMTLDEKLLDRVIAKKFSEKQQEIISKRKAAEKAPTKELAEGESVEFNTPEGNKIVGERVIIPGFEKIDMVIVKEGLNNVVYDLASGTPIAEGDFTKENAIKSIKDDFESRNITQDKIYNLIYKSTNTSSLENSKNRVPQINPSSMFESYSEKRKAFEKAEYEKLPLKFNPEEIKKLKELKKRAEDFGIEKMAKEIEGAIITRAKEGTFKPKTDYYEGLLKKDIDEKIKKEAEDKGVPYPKEYLKETPRITINRLKQIVNEGFKRDKFESIPEDVRKIMLDGYQKNIDILNKYGYYPDENTKTFFDKLYQYVAAQTKRENKESQIVEAKKELISALDYLNKAHEKEFGKKAEAEVKPKEEVKVYNAKDLKANPEVLKEDKDYYSLTYPKSFVGLSTNMLSLKNNGFENAKEGDVINIFKKDYVVEGFMENKKNPNETKVKLIRVDKEGNLLREQDLSKKEQKEGKAKEFEEEEEIEVEEAEELTKDDLKKAEAKFAAAEDRFKKARNRIEATQVKQAGMFGGEQKGMFAMGGAEAKSTLDPLRKAAKEAKAELDNLRNRLKVQEVAQPELAPVESKSDEDFVDKKIKLIKEQGKPLSEFKVGDKVFWASDWDKRWKQYSEGTIVKAGNDYEIKRFSEHPTSKNYKTFVLSSNTDVMLKPENEAKYTGEEAISKATKAFTTKNGRQKIEYEKGQLIVRDAKTGKEVSLSTRKKALDEYVENFDFSKGKNVEELEIELPTNLNEEEGNLFIADKSFNPLELVVLYSNETKEMKLSGKEQMIAELGIGTVDQNSFNKEMDRNFKTGGMAFSYFRKGGSTLDDIASQMERHYGVEFTPEDIGNFIINHPRGSDAALREGESRVAQRAAERFKELTGLNLDNTLANKIIDAEMAKAEAFEQELIKQEYETREQLEAEYYKASAEADRLAEKGNRPPVKESEKTQEKELAKEYKEVVGKASKKAKENAKKEFVDRNFDNIVEKLKIQIKCPT